jgi:uncharacterized protein YdeI (YjbR/CyaY-like superfamily)
MPATNPVLLHTTLPLQKLDSSRGGYFYVAIESAIVDRLSKGKATRLQCLIDEKITLHCGLNHLRDGNFFIIVAGKHVKLLQKKAGDAVTLTLSEDPEPLGVPVPEVLEALLEQDEALKNVFDSMTDGKKRSLIFLVKDIKDIDRQVQKATAFLTAVKQKWSPYRR